MSLASPTLAELQRRVQAHVLDPHRDSAAALEQAVAATRGIGANQRLAVYTDAYRLRLLEILGEDYPALATWLGPDAFDDMGSAYLRAHPSDNRSVRWFGRHLGTFLDRHAPDQPWLAELARFEWARGLAFDAADAEPLEIGEVAAVPAASWPGLGFETAACVQRLDFRFDIPGVYPDLLSGQRPDTPAVTARPAAWILWRHELVVQWRRLEADEARAFDAIAGGTTFGSMCELLAGDHDEEQDAALRAASMLKRWIGDGLVVGLREASETAGDRHGPTDSVR